MRIALFSTLYPFRGGIAQFSGSLYHALSAEHETRAYTFSRQYPDFLFPGSSQYVTPDDKVKPIKSEAILDSVNPLTYFSAAGKIRKFNPDLFISNFWLPFFGPSVGTMAGRLRSHCKTVSVLHNVVPHEKRPLDAALTKYFLDRHHGFITLSEAVKNDLLALRPNAPVIVLPHPLYDHFGAKTDTHKAQEKLRLPKNKKILLYFGYIRDYKGLDILIESMSMLPDDYHLVLAGESYGDFSGYDQLITTYGVREKITVINRYIPDTEVALLFSAADVCVLPYKSATQSGVTAISLHFELPLIVTNVGGLKELVQHGKTGLLVERPEAGAVAGQVLSFFSEHGSTNFASNIRELKTELSWSRFAGEVVKFAATL
jgi:glycosyltransferase involved in cell wall biosynthesis